MFKWGDLIIYGGIFGLILTLFLIMQNIPESKSENVEIYVNNKLSHIYKLQEEQKIIDVDTDIGGVTVEIKDKKVRVTSSYSPKKLCVKQGWIQKSGETIIGVPDKLIIKITGDEMQDLDAIIR
ncbi:MAG: NusG domain II-containing protein [Fusobacteriota bacterium]